MQRACARNVGRPAPPHSAEIGSEDGPDPFQTGYKIFLGSQLVYERETAESKLRFENLQVSEIDSSVIPLTLRGR